MPLSFKIAIRYLFSKKSHSSINAISAVSVCGVAVATMAMICTLSVYNGFQEVIATLYSDINPQIEITAKEGKTIDTAISQIAALSEKDWIASVTPIIEDEALAVFGERQIPVTLKGVPDNYERVSGLNKALIDGCVAVGDTALSYAVIGVGVANNLQVGSGFMSPIELYTPRRKAKINMIDPMSSFNKGEVFCSGVFSVSQPEYDDKIIFVPINICRELFDYTTEASSLEIKLISGTNERQAKNDISELLGDGYSVKNRIEQQSQAFSMMQIEKWITLEILSFVLLIAAFNIVGSVSMLIIDKRDNINTLYNMGADSGLISKIFFAEGCLISAIGAAIGLIIGLGISLVQEHFGLLKMGDTFIVEAYPVKVIWTDIFAVIFIVSLIGFAAAWYPVKYLNSRTLKFKGQEI
ncbi:MAG: FtsX-like permease family protein [Bacteroidales bacterium]